MEDKTNNESKMSISHFAGCKKRIIITTREGKKYSSKWFVDEDYIAVANKSNCTLAEINAKKELLKKYNFKENDIAKWDISIKRDEDVIYVTRHAEKRLKERNGWNKKTIDRMVYKIFTEGVTVNKKDHPWAVKISANCYKPVYKIYGNFVYIFSGTTLVTVLNIPQKTKNNKKTITRKETVWA